MGDTISDPQNEAPVTLCVDEATFRTVVARHGTGLLTLCMHLSRQVGAGRSVADILVRPFLSLIVSQAGYVEELLDAYGAKRNRTWRPVRSCVATIRHFSRVHHIILHCVHTSPSYCLSPDCIAMLTQSSRDALVFTGETVLNAARLLIDRARALDILPLEEIELPPVLAEEAPLPPGRLVENREVRNVASAREHVLHLSTAFLALAAESQMLQVAARHGPDAYHTCIPDPVNEADLRSLEQRFHGLQSVYDTHVSTTDLEYLDADLLALRGYITSVYHLLEVATALVHFYERHVKHCPLPGTADEDRDVDALVDCNDLLACLMGFAVKLAGHCVLTARSVCQAMIRRYSEVGRIVVSAPRYRGFHVRPSTLISRIAHHYGSPLTMELNGDRYDAGSPLELFRANEEINAKKRRWFTREVARLLIPRDARIGTDIEQEVNRVILEMAKAGKVVIYEQPLEVGEAGPEADGDGHHFIIDAVTRLQSLGKIDIQADIDVVFVGDTRVLEDIRLLAESGYGEDNFGNNIALPEALSYLRR